MSRSASWWLLAAGLAAGLIGIGIKATDVRNPGERGAARPRNEAREAALPHSDTSRAMEVARAGPTPSAPSSAAPAPARSDEDDVPPPAEDFVASAPRRTALPPDDGGDAERPHRMGRHRAAHNRARTGRSTDGGSFSAGVVAGEGESLPTGGGGTTHSGVAVPAAPAASAGERGTPQVVPPPATDVTFSSGDERQFATETPVEITDTPNLAGHAGTLSFWLQPTWQDGNQDDASLLELGDGRLRIVKNVDYLRFEWTDEAGGTGGIGAPITEWKPGEWHAVTTTWNGTSFALYIDGRLVSEKADAGNVGLPGDATLVIGSNFPENRPIAPGVIEKVDVRRRPLTAGEVANQFAAVAGSAKR